MLAHGRYRSTHTLRVLDEDDFDTAAACDLELDLPPARALPRHRPLPARLVPITRGVRPASATGSGALPALFAVVLLGSLALYLWSVFRA